MWLTGRGDVASQSLFPAVKPKSFLGGMIIGCFGRSRALVPQVVFAVLNGSGGPPFTHSSVS